MRKDFYRKVRKFNIAYKRKKLWHKIVMFLSAVVVFCTTYALILPAITLERDYHIYEDDYSVSVNNNNTIQPYAAARKIYSKCKSTFA